MELLTDDDKFNMAIERFWKSEEFEGTQPQLSSYDENVKDILTSIRR